MSGNTISSDVPKSTIAIGVAFWGVLVALGGWNLASTIAMREQQAKMLNQQENQQGMIIAMLNRQNGVEIRLQSLETQVALLKNQVERSK